MEESTNCLEDTFHEVGTMKRTGCSREPARQSQLPMKYSVNISQMRERKWEKPLLVVWLRRWETAPCLFGREDTAETVHTLDIYVRIHDSECMEHR